MTERIKGNPYATRHGKEWLEFRSRLLFLHTQNYNESVEKSIKSVESKMDEAAKEHNKLIDEHQKGEQ